MGADVCEGAGEILGVRVGGEGLDRGVRGGGAERVGESGQVVMVS